MSAWLVLYLAGVAVGLWRVSGPVAAKIGLSLLWPLGPLAGVLVVLGLMLVSCVAFPPVGAGALIGAAVLWWLNT